MTVASTRKSPKRGKKTRGYEDHRERLVKQRDEMLSLYKKDLRTGQESMEDGTEDIVDRANNAYSRELTFSLSDGERALLLQIEEALDRIGGGTYGSCANCAEEISEERLQAVAWARYCIDCQELEEKGLLHE